MDQFCNRGAFVDFNRGRTLSGCEKGQEAMMLLLQGRRGI